jgi:hypothetical protein
MTAHHGMHEISSPSAEMPQTGRCIVTVIVSCVTKELPRWMEHCASQIEPSALVEQRRLGSGSDHQIMTGTVTVKRFFLVESVVVWAFTGHIANCDDKHFNQRNWSHWHPYSSRENPTDHLLSL